jgi:hypothetical protein
LSVSGTARGHDQPSTRPNAALDRRVAFALLATGLVLRILVALLRRTPFFSDEIQYLSMARDILATGTHTLHFFWPAGYGYFGALVLAIVGDAPRAVLIAQAILSASVGPMIYALALRCGFDRPASAAAAFFYLVLIQPLLAVGTMLSDTFFCTLTLAALFLLMRDRSGRVPIHLAAGFLLGWAWASRSIGLIAVPMAIAWILGRPLALRRRVILAVSLGASLALPVGFVLARNWDAHHAFALEANAGFNLWRGNNPDTDLRYPARQQFAPLPGETPALAEARARREGIGYVLHHPQVFALRWLYRSSQILGPNPGRESIHAFRDRIGMRPIVGFHLAESILLWSMSLAGLALSTRRNRIFLFCALYPAAYMALVAAVVAAPRYRLPAIPFVCVLFAGGLQALIDLKREGRFRLRNRRLWIAGIVSLIVIANMGWQLAREIPKAANPSYRDQWQ